MAIDTLNKRASAYGRSWLRIFSTPDGAVNAGDRLQIAGLYRAIAAAAPTLAAGPPYDVVAVDLYVAGLVEGEVYMAGASEGQTYTAGAIIGEVDV